MAVYLLAGRLTLPLLVERHSAIGRFLVRHDEVVGGEYYLTLRCLVVVVEYHIAAIELHILVCTLHGCQRAWCDVLCGHLTRLDHLEVAHLRHCSCRREKHHECCK